VRSHNDRHLPGVERMAERDQRPERRRVPVVVVVAVDEGLEAVGCVSG